MLRGTTDSGGGGWFCAGAQTMLAEWAVEAGGADFASLTTIAPRADGSFEVNVARYDESRRDRLLSRWVIVSKADSAPVSGERWTDEVKAKWETPEVKP